MKTAVIVCSNSGIDYLDHNYNIPVFRSVIVFGTEEFDDYTGIKAEDFYKRITEEKVIPSTAFMPMGKMINIYEDLKEQGYQRCLVLTISSKMSGLYQAVQLAADNVDDFEVVAFDTKILTYAQTYMALHASKMFEEGKEIEDVLPDLEFMRDNNHVIFALDTLEFLVKNGRLSRAAGVVGEILKVRPLLHVDKEGKVDVLVKARTSKKARALMVQTFLEEIEGKDVEAYIAHADAGELIDEVKDLIKESRPDLIIKDYFLTPVVGAHTGPKAIGCGYILKKN